MLQLLSRADSRGRAEKPGGQLEDDALSSLQVKRSGSGSGKLVNGSGFSNGQLIVWAWTNDLCDQNKHYPLCLV